MNTLIFSCKNCIALTSINFTFSTDFADFVVFIGFIDFNYVILIEFI